MNDINAFFIKDPGSLIIVSSLCGSSRMEPPNTNYFMPNQVMCVDRLASIECERSDPRFKPALRAANFFSQIDYKRNQLL